MHYQDEPSDKPMHRGQVVPNGKDEMNLAEFPIASLRSRGDQREAIVHEGYVVGKDGVRHHQKWVVSGDSVVGLPNEFDERVYVALMAITAQHSFHERRIPFSIYQVLQIMGLGSGRRSYEFVEQALDRLKGITIKTKGAFYDNERHELVHTSMAFNLIDKYWLRYREQDELIREEEGVPAYIIWGEDIWKSFKTGYIKDLELSYFYSLESPTARRLYRFLDKRMRYQDTYEIDIFELASRLGMTRYPYASRVKQKLQPALSELVQTGFLREFTFPEYKKYVRVRFVRAVQAPDGKTAALHEDRTSDETIVGVLCALGISEEAAQQLAENFDEDYIQSKAEFLNWKLTTRQRGRPVSDPAAWLVRAIEQDYQPPASFKTLEERVSETKNREAQWETIERQREEEILRANAQRQGSATALRQRYGTGEGEAALWQAVKRDLSLRTTKPAFAAWIAPTELLSIKDGIAVIGVPNKMVKAWLEDRFLGEIVSTIGSHVNREVTLHIEVFDQSAPDLNKSLHNTKPFHPETEHDK